MSFSISYTLGMFDPSKACALYAFLNSITAFSCRSSFVLHRDIHTYIDPDNTCSAYSTCSTYSKNGEGGGGATTTYFQVSRCSTPSGVSIGGNKNAKRAAHASRSLHS